MASSANQSDSLRSTSLSWLLRLRWTAVAGQLATIVFVTFALHIPLPIHALMGILIVTAMSNGILHDLPLGVRRDSSSLFAAIMALDVILLTAMLYWTGGVHNPFTSFYLVHIALGAMVLHRKSLWTLVALYGTCFAFLFLFYQPLEGITHGEHDHGASFQFHLRGMAVAFVLTSTCIAYFVGQMHEALQERETQLAESCLRATRNEQFSALAALSAGVAHELGSPLGTIAVVSRELERALEIGKNNAEIFEDAQLIRTEVERCRIILDRLNLKSTSRVGDAPDCFEVATLLQEIHTSLGSAHFSRLAVKNSGVTGRLFLPLAPLAQALGVLVQNACDADESGTPVMLELRPEVERIVFEVRDRGPGLAPAAQKRAGEPFFSTKPPGRGMGLGLFLVRTLASRLGGELKLDPNPGGGTCATLILPFSAHSPLHV